MARSSFLFRTDAETLAALKRWASDDLRSVNGQLEFIVRKALRDAGRTTKPKQADTDTD
ncbi:MAG: Arc family DNA binding domain-containing protein [Pseudomonadota bacterium]